VITQTFYQYEIWSHTLCKMSSIMSVLPSVMLFSEFLCDGDQTTFSFDKFLLTKSVGTNSGEQESQEIDPLQLSHCRGEWSFINPLWKALSLELYIPHLTKDCWFCQRALVNVFFIWRLYSGAKKGRERLHVQSVYLNITSVNKA
jgi:hypothetical protein